MSNVMKSFLATMILVLLCSNAHALTIGPVVETKTIIVEAGEPVQIVESKKLTLLVKPITRDVPAGKVTKDYAGWALITPWDLATWTIRLKALRLLEQGYPDLVKTAIETAKSKPVSVQYDDFDTSHSKKTACEFSIVRKGQLCRPDTGIVTVRSE